MVATVGLNRDASMQSLVDEVAKELVITGVDHGEGLIALPQTYPGGASVVVRVRGHDNEFFVSDQGNGYMEAELLGGATVFARLAPQIAQFHGVEYDGSCFFTTRVTREWLANAVLFVGSASRKTVEQTAQKLGEERDHDLTEVFRATVREFFGAQARFDYEMRGHSLKNWRFDAAIIRGGSPSLIELVSPSHVSINSAFVKFTDIARLDSPVHRTVMLTNPDRTNQADKVLLGEAADVVVPFERTREAFAFAA